MLAQVGFFRREFLLIGEESPNQTVYVWVDVCLHIEDRVCYYRCVAYTVILYECVEYPIRALPR